MSSETRLSAVAECVLQVQVSSSQVFMLAALHPAALHPACGPQPYTALAQPIAAAGAVLVCGSGLSMCRWPGA
jgi:hypothetical protein